MAKLRAFTFSAAKIWNGAGSTALFMLSTNLMSLRELKLYTLLTSSRLAAGTGPPVTRRTFPTSSAQRPSSSACVALRLRSRQVR